VKFAIVAPLPVVGPRVRGNVPEVITYRIGGIAAGIGPKLVKSYALQQKIRFYLDHIERFYGASQRLKGGVTRSLWRWSDASQGKATRFDRAERPKLLSSARDCRGPSTS
jgi:hypothetical protein